MQSLFSQTQELRAIEDAARASDWKRVEQLSGVYLKRHPNDRSILYILPLAQMRLGKFDRALVSAQHLRAFDSLRIQPWLMISECEMALNRMSDAVSTLERVRVRFPDSVQATWALGMAYARSGRYEEAIEPLEEAMFRRPDVPGITEQLARCYHATGRFSESAELFQAVTDRSPNNADAWLKYGESLLAMRKPEVVRPVAEDVRKLLDSPYSETRCWATCVLLRVDRFREDATASARVMLSDGRNDAGATESRSKVLYHLVTNPFVLHECRDLVVRALSDHDIIVVDAAVECLKRDAETYPLDDAAAVSRLIEICRTNRGSMQGDSLDALSRVTPRLRATVAQGLSTVTVLPGNEKRFAAAVEVASRREDEG
jgi:tetratricopeptide (TPR) repeat protein